MRSHILVACTVAVAFVTGTGQSRLQSHQSEPFGNPLCDPNEQFPNATVMMCGLDNPRGIAFDQAGTLYVAEAGRGDAPAEDPVVIRDDERPDAAIQVNCTNRWRNVSYSCGASGAISRLRGAVQERFATGFPSALVALTNAAGNAQVGPNGISFLNIGLPARRGAYVPVGLWDDPADREANYPMPLGAGFGQVAQIDASGAWQYVVDIAGFVKSLPCQFGSTFCDIREQTDPNRGNHPDSNPYAVLARPDHLVIVDPSANAVVRVDVNGRTSLLATFPHVLPPAGTCSTLVSGSVPVSLAVGPDGAYYIGEHTGFPFYAGQAKVYRVQPGEEPTVFVRGFSTINGIAFDATRENLYVLQYYTSPRCGYQPPNSGAVIRVHHPSQPDETRSTVVYGLDKPTSITVGPDGALYVTNKGVPTLRQVTNDAGQVKITVDVGVGEILRFSLPAPNSVQ